LKKDKIREGPICPKRPGLQMPNFLTLIGLKRPIRNLRYTAPFKAPAQQALPCRAVPPPVAPEACFQHVAPEACFQHVTPKACFQHVTPKACFQHVTPKACFQHDGRRICATPRDGA
ncbi:MAG: hypothetical protein AAF755_15005, partial [Pseudomonadota bacterium]